MENYFAKAEEMANEQFSHFDGNDGWDNLVQDDYNYATSRVDDISSSLPYDVVVTNANATTPIEARILGANQNKKATNYNNPTDITLSMDSSNVSYEEFLESIKSSPFKVGMMYLQSSNASQPFKGLTLKYKESNGRESITPFKPKADLYQNIPNATIIRYKFPVNAYTEIVTTILPSTTLTISFYPMQELDLARGLQGRSVAKEYARPNLSQFQMPNGRGLIG